MKRLLIPTRKKWACLGAAISLVGLFWIYAASANSPRTKPGAQVRLAFSGKLPKLDGEHLQAKVVEVTYGPGEFSPAHSHPCPVIGYVLEGAVRMQVEGEAEAVYKAGDTFYEAPNGVHKVSANASDKVPAKFLASFICDHDALLTVPPPGAKH